MSAPRSSEATDSARSSRHGVHRVLSTCGWVVGGGVLLLLLSTACDTSDVFVDFSTVEGEVKAGTTVASDEDADGIALQADAGEGVTASCNAEVQAFDHRLGGGMNCEVDLAGGDTHAEFITEQTLCFDVTETDARDVFEAGGFQIETGCDDGEGSVDLDLEYIIVVEDGSAPGLRAAAAPIVVRDGHASVACGDTQVTVTGLPAFAVNIAGFRYGVALNKISPQLFQVEAGHRVVMTYRTSVTANLVAGASDFSSISVSGNYEGTADFGLTRVPCSVECTTNAQCAAGQFCEGTRCLTPRFASDPLNFTLTSNPSPIVAGQPFAFGFTVDGHEDDLQLYTVALSLPLVALDYTGIAATNQGIAGCTVGPFGRPVLTTVDPNEVYIDRDGSAAPDPNDPTISFGTNGTNQTVALVLQNGGDGSATGVTIPTDTTVSCSGFFGLFTATTPGSYPVVVTLTSVDPTSGGADDGIGLAPLTRTFNVTFDNIAFALDRDGDGTPDDQDGCPDDPEKTSPGLCGCGFDDLAVGEVCETEQPGRCEPGTIVCSAGTIDCTRINEPIDEICNEIDDDCDGEVDEDLFLGAPCDTGELGVCSNGVRVCETTTLECKRVQGPSSELPCNGLDEDCNGVVDDGCQKGPLTSLASTLTLDQKPEKDKITVKGTFSWIGHGLDLAAEGLRLIVEHAVGAGSVRSESVLAPGTGWKTKIDKKGNAKWSFKDTKDGALGDPDSKDAATVSCNVKKQVCTVKVTVQSVDLPAFQAGAITVGIAVGDDLLSDTRAWESKSKGKKLVAAKE